MRQGQLSRENWKKEIREKGEKIVLKSFTDQIYEILKEKILALELKFGEQINVQELSKELKVSSTPIRDALNRLSQEDLVEIVPRVGYYVVDLQPKYMTWIYDLRKMFESYALETGINNINTQKLLEIKEETKKLQNEQSKGHKQRRFYKTDRELHELIVKGSPNEKLHQMYFQIYNFVIISQRMNPNFEPAIKEHLELIDLVLKKDIERAKYKLMTHIDNACRNGIKALKEGLRNSIYGQTFLQQEKTRVKGRS